MNLPTIPTDNLYKFIAIAGIVTAAFGRYQMLDGMHQTHEMVRVMELDSIRLADRERELTNYLNRHPNDVRVLDSVSRGISQLGTENNRRAINISYDLDALTNTVVGGRNTYFSGVVLTIVGFILWFIKVQRHLDDILVLQRKELEAKVLKTATTDKAATPE